MGTGYQHVCVCACVCVCVCVCVCLCVCVCVYTLSGGMMSNTSDWSLNPLLTNNDENLLGA